jgi:uncharacterized protein (TIGR02679 family)
MSQAELSLPSEAACYICENPGIVVAAADRFGGRCGPIVCTEGMPSAAVLDLLQRLRAGDARLRFHADFDWGGLRIGNILYERFQARPWRFTSCEYRQAAKPQDAQVRLSGTPSVASWDPELAPMMQEAGQAVFEEQCVDELLEDLWLGAH